MKNHTEAIEDKALNNMAVGMEHGLTAGEVTELLKALRTWREMAVSYADILAASAEMALDRKSTSKSERQRQLSIVKSCASDLHYEMTSYRTRRDRQVVLDRLLHIEAAAEPLRPGHSHSNVMKCCAPCPAFKG